MKRTNNITRNKKANMFFASFLIVLLIFALTWISIVASNRLNNIDLKIGLIENNIELVNSRINSEKYFIKEAAESSKVKGDYGIINEFGTDVNDFDRYDLNKVLDVVIERKELKDETKILKRMERRNTECSFLGSQVIKGNYNCLDTSNKNFLVYFDKELNEILVNYNKSNDIDFSSRFAFAFDMKNDKMFLYGFLDSVEKSATYKSSEEFGYKKDSAVRVTRDMDFIIETKVLN